MDVYACMHGRIDTSQLLCVCFVLSLVVVQLMMYSTLRVRWDSDILPLVYYGTNATPALTDSSIPAHTYSFFSLELVACVPALETSTQPS